MEGFVLDYFLARRIYFLETCFHREVAKQPAETETKAALGWEIVQHITLHKTMMYHFYTLVFVWIKQTWSNVIRSDLEV